jgi:hypothetical protein
MQSTQGARKSCARGRDQSVTAGYIPPMIKPAALVLAAIAAHPGLALAQAIAGAWNTDSGCASSIPSF